MTPQEQEAFDTLQRLNTGVTIAFMVLLSSKKNLTFSYSESTLEAFPFDLFELSALREGDTTTFTLIPTSEVTH